jgi:hypothetical protein
MLTALRTETDFGTLHFGHVLRLGAPPRQRDPAAHMNPREVRIPPIWLQHGLIPQKPEIDTLEPQRRDRVIRGAGSVRPPPVEGDPALLFEGATDREIPGIRRAGRVIGDLPFPYAYANSPNANRIGGEERFYWQTCRPPTPSAAGAEDEEHPNDRDGLFHPTAPHLWLWRQYITAARPAGSGCDTMTATNDDTKEPLVK